MCVDFGNSKLGNFAPVFIKVLSANRAIFMSFHAKVFRCCRNFVFPRSKSMWSKIDINFLFLHSKCSIHKSSGIFHFAFFFAGRLFDYRSCCSPRFAFSVGAVVLANSFRFANGVRPSIRCFAPIVRFCLPIFAMANVTNCLVRTSCIATYTICSFAVRIVRSTRASMRSVAVCSPFSPVVYMNVGLFGIIIRHGLTAPIHHLVVSLCPNKSMPIELSWSYPIKLATYRNRYFGFVCIRHWSSVIELVLNIYVCISLSFGVVVCKHVALFVSHFESNRVAAIQHCVRWDLVNEFTIFQSRIHVATFIAQSTLRPKLALFAPYRNGESLRCFKFVPTSRGGNTAIGMLYPHFHGNIALCSVR